LICVDLQRASLSDGRVAAKRRVMSSMKKLKKNEEEKSNFRFLSKA